MNLKPVPIVVLGKRISSEKDQNNKNKVYYIVDKLFDKTERKLALQYIDEQGNLYYDRYLICSYDKILKSFQNKDQNVIGSDKAISCTEGNLNIWPYDFFDNRSVFKSKLKKFYKIVE